MVRNAYQRMALWFNWAQGDLLMMDNVNFSHGRDHCAGNRSLIVSMLEESGINNYINTADRVKC